MSNANERQVGGDHYRKHGKLQHWDMVAHFGLDYYQGCITKYVMRWRDKGGVEDLKKARHYLDKYIELAESPEGVPEDPAEQVAASVEPLKSEQPKAPVPEGGLDIEKYRAALEAHQRRLRERVAAVKLKEQQAEDQTGDGGDGQ